MLQRDSADSSESGNRPSGGGGLVGVSPRS